MLCFHVVFLGFSIILQSQNAGVSIPRFSNTSCINLKKEGVVQFHWCQLARL